MSLYQSSRWPPDLKSSCPQGPREEPGCTILFSQKVPASELSPGSPVGPLWREIPAAGHSYVSLNKSLIIFLSESPVREPLPCSLTRSPRTGILRHQSHWPIERILFIHSFTHSCMSAGVPPKKGPSYIHMGKNIRSPYNRAPRTRKAHIKWGATSFPKGIVSDTAISNPLPCSLRHDTFHLLWVNLSWKNKGLKFFSLQKDSF